MDKKLWIVIFAGSLVACTKKDTPVPVIPAPAQIVHNIVNVEVAYQKHAELDLDNDGKYEYSFMTQLVADGSRSWTYFAAIDDSQLGSKILVQEGPEHVTISDYWATPLAKGTVISDALPAGSIWGNHLQKGFLFGTSVEGTLTRFQGPWAGKLNTYMAIKFRINGKYHYGWIGLTHPGGGERVLIEEYAYNKTPEQPIEAGQY